MYTTYFARLRSLPPDVVPIAICAKPPAWYRGACYTKLAPRYGFFSEWKKTGDDAYYVKCFREQVLARLDARTVYEELVSLAGTEHIALVCFETPDKFCHRHLVAEWLRESGYDISEFNTAPG